MKRITGHLSDFVCSFHWSFAHFFSSAGSSSLIYFNLNSKDIFYFGMPPTFAFVGSRLNRTMQDPQNNIGLVCVSGLGMIKKATPSCDEKH